MARAKAKSNQPKKTKNAQVGASVARRWLWPFVKWVGVYGSIGAIAVAAVTYGMVLWLSKTLPHPRDALVASGAAPIQIVANNGEVLANYGPNQGDWIAFEEIPPDMVQAIIAIEDRRFFEHGGIDLRGIARAVLANLRSGGVVEGGSTLTQQLSKNLYLTPSRTFTRKMREALIALAVEQRFSKEEILAAYLNRVYLGSGAYGIEAASYRYFGHSARTLSLAEASLLAGVVKAPSRLSPKADLEASLERRALVLEAMAQEDYVTPGEAALVGALPLPLVQNSDDPSVRYFTDWVAQQIRRDYPGQNQRLKIYTTLDLKAQKAAQSAVMRHLPDGNASTAGLQTALVALSDDGAVQAMIGGRSYQASSFNRATVAVRQPGSAFKTFVYLAALENGMGISDRLRDTPIQLENYAPKNYGGRFSGQLISLSDAYIRSVNSVAVKLGERVDRPKVANMARRLGISTPIVVEPSIALGTSEVRVIELAAAYGVIANGGQRVSPYGIREVRGPRGDLVEAVSIIDDGPQDALNPRVAAKMLGLMQGVVQRGTGKNAQRAGRVVGGKTGTTQNGQDGWFVGFSDRLTAAVWVGRDDNRPVQGLTGGGMPARIWGDFIAAAQADEPSYGLLRRAHRTGRPLSREPRKVKARKGFFEWLARNEGD